MSENPENEDGKIVNPPNNPPSGENTDGEIVNPGMAADVDDGVGDAGDQANDVRFAQEQSLIGEQSQGVFPDEDESKQVPDEEPAMDEAMGDVDAGDPAGDGDSSDDPAHSGDTA
ncbi:SET domain-containing protein [Arthrobacter pigmenti]